MLSRVLQLIGLALLVQAQDLSRLVVDQLQHTSKLVEWTRHGTANQGLPVTDDALREFFTLQTLMEQLYVDNMEALSPACAIDFDRIRKGLANMAHLKVGAFEVKLLNLIDSMGKLPAGFLKGQTSLEGRVGECQEIQHTFDDSVQPFTGQFVRIGIELGDERTPSGPTLPISWDLCLPGSCTKEDLTGLLMGNMTLKHIFAKVYTVVTLKDQALHWTVGSYVTLGYMAVIVGLVLAASLIDMSREKNNRSGGLDFFVKTFSIMANFSDILHMAPNKPGMVNQLHAIRFFSMCWVTLGHTMMIAVAISGNLLDVKQHIKDWVTMLPILSYYAVDTFFFQAGFLLAFLWFRAYRKNRRLVNSFSNWVLFYVHRFFRLSPAYYLVIAFFTFVFLRLDYVTQAPIIILGPLPDSSCPDNWWYLFLYINNFFGIDNAIFILSPLLLLPFTVHKIFGFITVVGALLASTVYNFVIVYINDLPPYNFDFGHKSPSMKWNRVEYETWMYNAPWIRCQPYLIGFLLGYFMHHKMEWLNLVGWLLCVVVVGLVAVPIHDWVGGQPMNLWARALYSSLSRWAWSYLVGWVLFSCYYGYGGPVNRFLLWPGWIPLGRLSYSAYLLHLIVVAHIVLNIQIRFVFTGVSQMLFLFTIPIIAATYIVAIFWSAMFELPIAKIEALAINLLRGKPKVRPTVLVVSASKDEDEKTHL